MANIDLREIEGEFVVVGPQTQTLPLDGIRVGDVVRRIDGEAADDRVRAALDLAHGANQPARAFVVGTRLVRTNREHLALVVDDGTGERKWRGPTYELRELQHSDAVSKSWRTLEPGILYVDMDQFDADDIPPLEEALASAQALVVDLRAYPAFIIEDFLGLLSGPSLPFVRYRAPVLSKPGTWREALGPASGGGGDFAGPVVVLVDESTMSRSEYFVMALQVRKATIVVGSQTAGTDGNVSPIQLPGGLRLSFSGLEILYPNGARTQSRGVRVDIPVQPSIAGVRAGRDEILEAGRTAARKAAERGR
jgi:C-terminal processing protease CtpA/Prc